jgi:hypothetical protein
MNTVGPKFIDIEPTFDAFVPTFRNGIRLDEFFKGVHKTGLNADYYFPADRIILELKTLENDQSDRAVLFERLEKCLVHFGYPKSMAIDILFSGRRLPHKVDIRLRNVTGNALRNALKKANRQLRASKKLQGLGDCRGILIVANDADLGFNPVQSLHFLADSALKLSHCETDAIIYTTPNTFYDDADDQPNQYWIPTYAEGRESLGDFVNPLGEAWLRFVGHVTGDVVSYTMEDSITDEMMHARPIHELKKPS